MALSWKPVRKGKTFCAPACGADCTIAAYRKAHADGKRVKTMLKNPKGWRVHVWENMGWHVSLRKGSLSLHWSYWDGKLGSFWTLLSSDPGGHGGDSFWTPQGNKTFRTPDNAIKFQLQLARTFVKRCQEAIDKVA